MATTGQVYPSSGTSAADSASGHSDNDWTGQTLIYTANATSNADTTHCASVTAATFDSPDQTYVLYAKGFDFSAVPDGSTVNGVTCRVGAFYTAGQGSGSVDLLQLLDTAGALAGTNQAASAVALTTTYTTVITKGSASDKWGLALTAAWVKDPDFGVGLGMLATAANADVFTDFVSLEIDYTPAVTVNAGAAAAAGTAGAGSHVSQVTAGTGSGTAPEVTAATVTVPEGPAPPLISESPAVHRAETW